MNGFIEMLPEQTIQAQRGDNLGR